MKKSKKLMILGLSAATAAVAATGAVSSFAWFAINSEVTATGMKIKADTSEYLEIKMAADTAWSQKTVASTQTSTDAAAKSLKPTYLAASGTEAKNGDASYDPKQYSAVTAFANGSASHIWVSSASNSVDSATKGGSVNYTDVTSKADLAATDTNASNNVYTLVNDFDVRIRFLGDKTTKYNLNATVDWDSSIPSDDYVKDSSTYNLHKAVRVLMVVGTMNQATNSVASQGTGYVFSSVGGGTDWSDTATTIKTEMVADDSTFTDKLGSGIRIRTFVYFDGEDSNCFSSAVKLNSIYSLKFNFSVEKANA